MPKIPFIRARLFDAKENRHSIEYRLTKQLQKLRARSRGIEPPNLADQDDLIRWDAEVRNISFSHDDDMRIRRRADLIFERRKAASGVGHLRREDREALQCLRDGVRLVDVPSEERADEIASELHSEMPWMGEATTHLWHAMRRSAHRGEPGFRLPPLLLNGPPGIGKSVWARRVSDVLHTPMRIVEASGEQASFGVVGSQRGWGTAFPGKPLQTILQHLVGNPVIVVDEVEKAGSVTSLRGMSYGIAEAMLPLLERATAEHWECPYYQVRFDMSWISWVLTANDITSLPEPFLSRVEVVTLEPPTVEHLVAFAVREGDRRELTLPAIEAATMTIETATDRSFLPNLRTVGRILDRAEVLEKRPVVH